MEKNTVTGKNILDFRFWILDCRRQKGTTKIEDYKVQIQNPKSKIQNQKGFSLLELMISMFIIIILISVALPTYQRSVQHARETVLSENLWQMRRAIDQYAADKGKLPQNIDDLVTGKYLRERPVDPVANNTDWEEIQGDDTNSSDGGQGLKDVKSRAEGEDSDGKKYSDY